jgi:hypothetical protein
MEIANLDVLANKVVYTRTSDEAAARRHWEEASYTPICYAAA